MHEQEQRRTANSTWGKLGLAAGGVACVIPFILFDVKPPSLPAREEWALLGVYTVALATCSLVASRRPLIGLLLLPLCFFGIMCLGVWWVTNN